MKMATGGLNAGEVGRFPASVALGMIEREEATEAVVQPSQAVFSETIKRGLSLVCRALDMKELMSVQLKQMGEATEDAIEAVEAARKLQKDGGGNFTAAREILEAKDREAKDREADTIKEKEDAVTFAKKAETTAIKAVKRAKNKTTANAKVAKAEKAVSVAQQNLLGVITSIDAAAAARQDGITGAIRKEQAALNQDVDTGMKELEEKLKELV